MAKTGLFGGMKFIDFTSSELTLPAVLFGVLLVLAGWAVHGLISELIPPLRHSRAPSRYLRSRQQARRGNAKACVACADMLEKGVDGAPYRPGLAETYLLRALDIYGHQARGGDGYAWLKMAEIHNRHHEPNRMTARADHAYRHALKVNTDAAARGDLNGMAFAGFQYFYGLGCIADPERAAQYLEGAARLGHAPSMKTLAEYYLLGVKKKPDPVTAAALYRRAALSGDAEAVERVGDQYLSSLGELASRELAYCWYAYAARLGRGDAAHKLQRIEADWTPKQLRDVQDRLRDWAPA